MPQTGSGATALAFAPDGANVVADRSEQGNEDTARAIEEIGGRSVAVRCDVTREEDVDAALAKTTDVFGRLDFAFNNVGIEQQSRPPRKWMKIRGIESSTSISAASSSAFTSRHEYIAGLVMKPSFQVYAQSRRVPCKSF